ncbi:MAG: MlaD family protein [Acidobacteria bacterium]|nr:MlaD family protein [Acidobacteriota bacterium]MCI0627147.1 MlaD family protein [Acidobacteriota bacterium]
MARKRLAWAELRVGILVIFSFTILAIAIILISGGAGFFTEKYELKTFLASANGLRKGSLVWLAGLEAGNVSAVNISSSPDPNRAVEVVMQVEKRYSQTIREDSIATLGSIGLLGDKYIDISRGSPGATPTPPGGEVKGSSEADIKKIMQNSNDLVANLGELVNKIDDITRKIDQGQGTIGKFINDPSMFNKLNRTVEEAHDLLATVKSGEGSIGRLISDRELYDRLNGTLTRFDSVAAKVEKGEGTLGRFVHDPAVYNRAESLLAKFNVVADRMEKGEGFLGKLSKDDALYVQFRDSVGKFSALAERMNQGEGTIGKLMVDPSLYSNINQASGELVKLLYDFRQNPKRFLQLKFGLF